MPKPDLILLYTSSSSGGAEYLEIDGKVVCAGEEGHSMYEHRYKDEGCRSNLEKKSS
jgi:hypothetical protein